MSSTSSMWHSVQGFADHASISCKQEYASFHDCSLYHTPNPTRVLGTERMNDEAAEGRKKNKK